MFLNISKRVSQKSHKEIAYTHSFTNSFSAEQARAGVSPKHQVLKQHVDNYMNQNHVQDSTKQNVHPF